VARVRCGVGEQLAAGTAVAGGGERAEGRVGADGGVVLVRADWGPDVFSLEGMREVSVLENTRRQESALQLQQQIMPACVLRAGFESSSGSVWFLLDNIFLSSQLDMLCAF
jgi:hypothetical protein